MEEVVFNHRVTLITGLIFSVVNDKQGSSLSKMLSFDLCIDRCTKTLKSFLDEKLYYFDFPYKGFSVKLM